ncbi:hypothetical protein HZZ00_02780 [Streptomyces sp. NEAU-sy36]|uniref:hypothetical protein n=1 Tax=unclassified Streptomyces TaxID=2593676 RepID=UPI0015D5BC94|nr:MULTISPECIES: hypothetical protein [unclassified Streptomyces]QLJ00010.1 hypothetical protein HZZ00_02780 [Streptomyces sp. NEAU-sy36]
MQGHGYGPPAQRPPHPAVLVLLRVLFVAIGILSMGFLAWVMQLRLAAVTRRPLDWALFVGALLLDGLSLVLVGSEPGDDITTARGYTGLYLLLATLVAVTVYYLVAEIRHYARRNQAFRAQRGIPAQQLPAQGAPAYGYPGPAAPYVPPAAPVVPGAPAAPPVSPHTPVPGPPLPHRPAPARIDQVRAELDELSDYLRKQDGQHEGGR